MIERFPYQEPLLCAECGCEIAAGILCPECETDADDAFPFCDQCGEQVAHVTEMEAGFFMCDMCLMG
jgi:predicted amidophosphoribosyltransferase